MNISKLSTVNAMNVMTSFGYEIMLTRGCCMLVPNIGCKQTTASSTGGPLTFFGVHTFFFF